MDAVGRATVPPSWLLKGGFLGILDEQVRRMPPEAPLLKNRWRSHAAADDSNSWQPHQNMNSAPNRENRQPGEIEHAK
jgi:hypothetical protein